jgi:hypothetical protein
MKHYRVAIFASVNIEAEDEGDAEEQVIEMIKAGQIRIRDYEFEVEDREIDRPTVEEFRGVRIYERKDVFNNKPYGLLYRVQPHFEPVNVYFEDLIEAKQWIDLTFLRGAYVDNHKAIVLNPIAITRS